MNIFDFIALQMAHKVQLVVRLAKSRTAWRLILAKILVVDDDDAVRMMLNKMLETASHDVVTAENGIQALNWLRKQVPDVVILDIIMPEKEGFETIVELRRDYPNLKIIAISGGGAIGPASYLKLAKKLGAHLTMEKPISMEKLRAAIRHLVPTEAQ
jgi:DNA-binding NtrC family response regulator